MDIAELGAIGELVGGVAVVASLVFVGVQVRRGAEAARSNAHQTAAANSTALLFRSADPQVFELSRSANENYEALSDRDRNSYDNHIMAYFNYFESLYYDHLQGAVHRDIWESRVNRMKLIFEERAGSRRTWRKAASLYGDAFRVFVETRILPASDA